MLQRDLNQGIGGIRSVSAAAAARESQGAGHWLRMAFSFPVMLMAILELFIYRLARGHADEPDIWWHLRNAEYLFQNHRIPDTDMYSFTVAGHPWMNHQWLSEIPYYLSWRAWGISGIEIASILLIQLLFVGLLVLSYEVSRNIKASVIACMLVAPLTVVSYGPRTALFGYAHLILLLIFLERFRSRNGALWPVPIVFCSWINMHGTWLLGLVVFGMFVGSGLVEGTWGQIVAQRWTPAQLRKLILTGAASVAALFVNPFWWKLVYYPFDFAFVQSVVKEHIEEWASLNFHELPGKIAFLVIVLFFVVALVRKRSWRLWDVALLLLALYSGLTYIRFLFLLAVVTAPLLASFLSFMPPYRPQLDKPVFNVAIVAFVLAGTLHFLPPMSGKELDELVEKSYPVAMQTYLKEHPLNGPVVNYYTWGGYLTWHNRDIKVFIDGRGDIFDYSGVLQEYVDLLGVKNVDATFDKYQIQYVMFPPGQPLTSALERDPRWKEAYRDDVVVLFARAQPTP